MHLLELTEPKLFVSPALMGSLCTWIKQRLTTSVTGSKCTWMKQRLAISQVSLRNEVKRDLSRATPFAIWRCQCLWTVWILNSITQTIVITPEKGRERIFYARVLLDPALKPQRNHSNASLLCWYAKTIEKRAFLIRKLKPVFHFRHIHLNIKILFYPA